MNQKYKDFSPLSCDLINHFYSYFYLIFILLLQTLKKYNIIIINII